ncbi:putative integral membrane protein conserved region-domain-containing protein [Sporodiniella umbellata]|nr:putative integral membrane protein conserved region-domain-containing protein [Sporodiniella umbellata]
MYTVIGLICVYVLGGLSFLPIMLFSIYLFSPKMESSVQEEEMESDELTTTEKVLKGWIELRKSLKETERRSKRNVYAELKSSALFIYAQDECQQILAISEFQVLIHHNKGSNDSFGRSAWIYLKSDEEEYYINCERAVDKEDWYYGLLAATTNERMDRLEPQAMKTFLDTLSDTNEGSVRWLNAVVGRVFLGMYKTQALKDFVQHKLDHKIRQTKLPSSLLGEIKLGSVRLGDSVPLVSQPKLLSLTPEGELAVEAKVDYRGAFQVVIRTECSPLRVPLVLSVTLRRLTGHILVKIKPPPSNRYWLGFYRLPEMDWEITPIVSDKQIKLNLIQQAIKAKLTESILEQLVLPNMDDFPFCPSTEGGIFGERVPRPSDLEPEEQEDPILLLPQPPTRRAESLPEASSLRQRPRHLSLPHTIELGATADLSDDLSRFQTEPVHPLDQSSPKKGVFYQMTGHLFQKKNRLIKPKISKELRDERDRESF